MWKNKMRYFLIGFVVVFVVAAGIFGIVYFIRQNTSCTVGASGTAATVTFSGPDAPTYCESILRQGAVGRLFYQYEGSAPQGSQICAGDHRIAADGRSVHFLVRDTDTSLFSAGRAMCKGLAGAGG
jgi:hypothetical protein